MIYTNPCLWLINILVYSFVRPSRLRSGAGTIECPGLLVASGLPVYVVLHSNPLNKLIIDNWIAYFSPRSRIVGMDYFHSLPVPAFAISQTGIITGIGILWEMSDFQYFQFLYISYINLYRDVKLGQGISWVTENRGHFAQFYCKY